MDASKQDQQRVKLKGVGDSLWVTLDPTCSPDILKEDLKRIFSNLRHLAYDSKVILDSGQPDHNEKLVEELGGYLKEYFKVNSVVAPHKKRSRTEERIRTRDMARSWNNYRSNALVIAGRVRSGQKITAKKHLLILGDVNPGGEIHAGGDIFIMGSLCGKALAGQPQNEDAIILALDFRPTQIQIGPFVAAGIPSSAENNVEYAHIENGNILVDDYLTIDPFGRLPWPEVR
jgi:septum site-determining protein MinC